MRSDSALSPDLETTAASSPASNPSCADTDQVEPSPGLIEIEDDVSQPRATCNSTIFHHPSPDVELGVTINRGKRTLGIRHIFMSSVEEGGLTATLWTRKSTSRVAYNRVIGQMLNDEVLLCEGEGKEEM
eukprot:CAMPEP_0196745092 /NCGR_PEP_ID=MMETSP1091-20130531/60094_1 /TAXON_ID=302021 /ORGANISM="Rhodomonas sp., Strain CCMP768" /LENGTH=129 /DNA_ID=CAMNT_0042091773 /DNA_START=59 /DNA_END=448 /DNA_ORIENTATION=+